MAALTFGGATSDRIDCGSAASLDNLVSGGGTLTTVAWVNPSAFTAQRTWMSKYRGSSQVGWNIQVDTSGFVRSFHERATTDHSYVASSLALTTGAWYCVAVVMDGTANTSKIYVGSASSRMTETTYSVSQGGAGAYQADGARSLFVGNVDAPTPAAAFLGDISFYAAFNRGLSLGELIGWQWRPQTMSGCVLFGACGFNGTGTQPDWSGNGNNGTVTGATASTRGAPVPSPFGWTRSNRYIAPLVVGGDLDPFGWYGTFGI